MCSSRMALLLCKFASILFGFFFYSFFLLILSAHLCANQCANYRTATAIILCNNSDCNDCKNVLALLGCHAACPNKETFIASRYRHRLRFSRYPCCVLSSFMQLAQIRFYHSFPFSSRSRYTCFDAVKFSFQEYLVSLDGNSTTATVHAQRLKSFCVEAGVAQRGAVV